MTEYKLISIIRAFQLHHWGKASNRLPALHKPSMCWRTCGGHSCSTIFSCRRAVFVSSVTFRSTPCDAPRLLSKKVNPTSDLQGFHCVLNRPPRSPQVEGQGHCKDDAHQHQERQPGLQKAHTADMFSMNQREEAEFDHVPRGAVFISHQIQCHGNM